jgi:hypothetical protein
VGPVGGLNFSFQPGHDRRKCGAEEALSKLVLVWLMGCQASLDVSTDARIDRDRYLATLRDTTQPPSSAMASCHALVDDHLRGDCALAVSRRSMSTDHEATWCHQVPSGIWQDECWFQRAESAAMRQDFSLAQTLCASSERFSEQCYFHLFQLQVQQSSGLVDDLPEAEEFLETLIASRQIRMAPQATERIWSTWFEQVAREHGWVDTETCQAVSVAHKEACISGLTEAERNPRR